MRAHRTLCVVLFLLTGSLGAFPPASRDYTADLNLENVLANFEHLMKLTSEHLTYAPDAPGSDGLNLIEFLTTTSGDCEDFAYYALMALNTHYLTPSKMLLVAVEGSSRLHALVWAPIIARVGDPTTGEVWSEDMLPPRYTPLETLTFVEAGIKFLR